MSKPIFKPYVPVVYSWWTDFDPSDKQVLTDTMKVALRNDAVECPQCQGHGKCVLKRDAYGKGKDFKGHCMNCNGWGWVKAGTLDATCKHEYEDKATVGNCLHEWECKKCGKVIEVDSSG